MGKVRNVIMQVVCWALTFILNKLRFLLVRISVAIILEVKLVMIHSSLTTIRARVGGRVKAWGGASSGKQTKKQEICKIIFENVRNRYTEKTC